MIRTFFLASSSLLFLNFSALAQTMPIQTKLPQTVETLQKLYPSAPSSASSATIIPVMNVSSSPQEEPDAQEVVYEIPTSISFQLPQKSVTYSHSYTQSPIVRSYAIHPTPGLNPQESLQDPRVKSLIQRARQYGHSDEKIRLEFSRMSVDQFEAWLIRTQN